MIMGWREGTSGGLELESVRQAPGMGWPHKAVGDLRLWRQALKTRRYVERRKRRGNAEIAAWAGQRTRGEWHSLPLQHHSRTFPHRGCLPLGEFQRPMPILVALFSRPGPLGRKCCGAVGCDLLWAALSAGECPVSVLFVLRAALCCPGSHYAWWLRWSLGLAPYWGQEDEQVTHPLWVSILTKGI